MAKRSSVVRALLGERKTLSSSVVDSSVKGDTTGSLVVDSAKEFQQYISFDLLYTFKLQCE